MIPSNYVFESDSSKVVKVNDEIYRYAIENSTQLHEVQKELIFYTKTKVDRSIMLTQPDQTTFFKLLLMALGAKKVIDIGVYTGLSALSAALAIPTDGKVVACDVSEEFTNVGKIFWEKAGVSNKIDLRIQAATKTLQELIDNGESGTYDFIFIDADKENYNQYYEYSLQLIRKGGIIALDNTLQGGRVLDETNTSSPVVAIRNLNAKISADQRVTKSFLTLADGITLITKN